MQNAGWTLKAINQSCSRAFLTLIFKARKRAINDASNGDQLGLHCDEEEIVAMPIGKVIEVINTGANVRALEVQLALEPTRLERAIPELW